MSKQYASGETYEKKLSRVIERLGASLSNYNYDRFGAWVEFRYKGELYRFDHSVENAKKHSQPISYGSDTFAQIVLSLEDLSRMIERGIYDLSTWIVGMRYLPPPVEIAPCFRLLGFVVQPTTKDEIQERFRQLSKKHHPDTGGRTQDFQAIKEAAEEAIRLMDGVK